MTRTAEAVRLRWAVPCLGALALLLGACDRGGNDAPASEPVRTAALETEEPAAEGRAVRTLQPEFGELRAGRSVSATLRARQDANVAAGASGRVLELSARPGDRVEAGQLVVRLDDAAARLTLVGAELAERQARIDLERARLSSGEAIGQAEAGLRAAEAALQQAEEQLEQLRELVEIGGAARSDLTALSAQVEQARSQRLQAEDALARARRAPGEDVALLQLRLEQATVQRRQAEQALADSEIRAPFGGTVAQAYVEVGEFAAAGQPAFRLQSHDLLDAIVDLPAVDADRLLAGDPFTLRYAGRDLRAELAGSARLADRPRQVRLTLRIAPEDATGLPVDGQADLSYQVRLAEGWLLPSGAVTAEAGATWVYLARGGVAERVPVTVLAESGALAAVQGLDPDVQVIHPRPLDVREGTRVRPQAE